MAMPTVESQLADHHAHISRLEAIAEQNNHRLASIENRLTSMENRADRHFILIIGIQFTTLVTLGTLILLKLGH